MNAQAQTQSVEQAHIQSVERVAEAVKAEAIKAEVPFPKVTPQPVDAHLVDHLRNQVADYDSAIADLQGALGDMNARLREYQRARARCMAAIDLEVDTKVLEA